MTGNNKGTTVPGYVNDNGQITVRDTGEKGTDFNARKFQVACSKCGYNYGANSTDLWQRKCPNCQGGMSGLSIDASRDNAL